MNRAHHTLKEFLSPGRIRVAWSSLVALLALALASCGLNPPTAEEALQAGFEELRATATATITEPARLESYLRLAEEMEAELTAFERFTRTFVADYRAAFTDHGTDQATLEQLAIRFRDRQRSTQGRYVELHLAMARTVTPQEWETLAKREATIVEQLLAGATGGGR